jgi:hypothetical protein
MEGEPPASPSILTSIQVRLLGQEVKEMDVKGAKALSERLAEAARNVDPTPAKAVGSGESERGPEVADTAAKG